MQNPPRSKLATNLRMTVTSKVVGSTLVALTCNLPHLSMRSDDTAKRILLVFMMQLHIPCSRWQQPVLCWLHASGLGNSCSLSSPAQCHQQHVGCGWKVRRHSANRHQYSFRNDVWVQAHISNTTAHPDTMLDVSGSCAAAVVTQVVGLCLRHELCVQRRIWPACLLPRVLQHPFQGREGIRQQVQTLEPHLPAVCSRRKKAYWRHL